MEEKSMKKSFSSLGFRFLIGTLVIYAVQMGVMTIVGAVKPEWLQDTTISLILAVLPLYLVGMPVLIAVVKRMPGEAPAKKSITPGQFVLALIMCFALMYCGNLVGTLITTVVGVLKGSAVDNALMTYATGSNMIVTFLYMVICAPILEEYIFRKLIVDRTVRYGQGVGMPVLIAVVKRMPGEAPAKKSITPGQFVLALIMCFALMYCGNLVGTLITTVVGVLKGSAVDNALMTYATGSNMIVTFLYMVICAPILEEYIFRKLIVDRTVKYGQGVAVVLSGLMFGLFHGNLNQFAYAFLLGMFLAFLYVKTGELKVTIGLHMCINFMGAVVSVLLLKAIHLEEYQEVIMNGADSQAVMDYMMKYLPGWIGYMIYVLFILAVLVTGIVLFIVYRKKLKLEPGQIAKGRRFKTVIGNPGMICYCIFWIAMIIIQMFPEIVTAITGNL